MTCSARSSASDANSCKHHQADRRPDPVQRREPGDATRHQERPWHDMPVVIVEQIRRRQQALRARPAGQDQVVPVEVAANASTARTTNCTAINAAAVRATQFIARRAYGPSRHIVVVGMVSRCAHW